MKSTIKILFAFLLFVLAACNNNSPDPEFNYQSSTPLTDTSRSTDTSQGNSQITLPGINTAAKNQTTASSISTNSNAANKNVNPEHGQPGHRCEIAVGAPLNKTPVTVPDIKQTQPVTVSNNQQVISPKTTTVATGINPAHDQPGHRCDIAVGAPLNSTPVTTPQQKQPEVVNKTRQVVSATTTAAGMNPPHGQPGHRCDIGVGTPLSQPGKKPATSLLNDSVKK